MKICSTCQARFSGDEGFCPHDGTKLVEANTSTPGQLAGTTFDNVVELDEFLFVDPLGERYHGRLCETGQPVRVTVFNQLCRPDRHEELDAALESLGALLPSSILAVHSYCLDHAPAYVIEERPRGQSLHDMLEGDATLDWQTALALSSKIGRILDWMAEHGVLHRGLHSRAVFVDDKEEVQVGEWAQALATFVESPIRAVKDGSVFLGYTAYMAPEVLEDGNAAGPASVVYSMGMLFYEMVLGRPAFGMAEDAELIERHLNEKPVALGEAVPDTEFHPNLDDLLGLMWAKKPDKRFQAPAAVIGALASLVGKTPTDIAPPLVTADDPIFADRSPTTPTLVMEPVQTNDGEDPSEISPKATSTGFPSSAVKELVAESEAKQDEESAADASTDEPADTSKNTLLMTAINVAELSRSDEPDDEPDDDRLSAEEPTKEEEKEEKEAPQVEEAQEDASKVEEIEPKQESKEEEPEKEEPKVVIEPQEQEPQEQEPQEQEPQEQETPPAEVAETSSKRSKKKSRKKNKRDSEPKAAGATQAPEPVVESSPEAKVIVAPEPEAPARGVHIEPIGSVEASSKNEEFGDDWFAVSADDAWESSIVREEEERTRKVERAAQIGLIALLAILGIGALIYFETREGPAPEADASAAQAQMEAEAVDLGDLHRQFEEAITRSEIIFPRRTSALGYLEQLRRHGQEDPLYEQARQRFVEVTRRSARLNEEQGNLRQARDFAGYASQFAPEDQELKTWAEDLHARVIAGTSSPLEADTSTEEAESEDAGEESESATAEEAPAEEPLVAEEPPAAEPAVTERAVAGTAAPASQPKTQKTAPAASAAVDVRDIITRARAAYSRGNVTEAKRLYEEAYGHAPNDHVVNAGLGQVYFDEGNHAQAVRYQARAVELRPTNTEYRLQLGMVYFRLARYQDAVKAWEAVKRQDPNNTDADRYIELAKKRMD